MPKSKRKYIPSGRNENLPPPRLRIEEAHRSEAELTHFTITNFGSTPAEGVLCTIFLAPDGIDVGQEMAEHELSTSFVDRNEIGTIEVGDSTELNLILNTGVLYLLIIRYHDSAKNWYGTQALFIKHGDRFRMPSAYLQY